MVGYSGDIYYGSIESLNSNHDNGAPYGPLDKLTNGMQEAYSNSTISQGGGKTRRSKRRILWITLGIACCISVIVWGCFFFGGAFPLNTTITTRWSKRMKRYDYIVVGGGPSGILVATKLAQNYNYSVLLIESGTSSQARVLQTLKKTSRNDESIISTTSATTDGLVMNEDHVNKFDVPLLWSGVASPTGSNTATTLTQQQQRPPRHHWPFSQMLLGRALGGCGLLNAMIYVRALRQDFEQWNSPLWTWPIMLEHLKQLEHYDIEENSKRHAMPKQYAHAPGGQNHTDSASWRGQGGRITTLPTTGENLDPVASLFVDASMERGWNLVPTMGFNHPQQERVGVSYYEFNIANGIRSSVAQSFLGGKQIPPTLDILTGATAQRVLFETKPPKTRHSKNADTKPIALGVEYKLHGDKNDQVYTALLKQPRKRTGGEVIIACGTILTPQLLANSGIHDGGNISNLQGVGKDLVDHPVMGIAYELQPEIEARASSIYQVASELQNYLTAVHELHELAEQNVTTQQGQQSQVRQQLGTFATPGFSAGAFLTSPWAVNKTSNGNNRVPDIQLTVFPRIVEPHILQYEKAHDARSSSSAMLVTVALLDAEARYQVIPKGQRQTDDWNIQMTPEEDESSFPLPSIALAPGNSTYLTRHDVERLAWGMEEVRRIFREAPLAQACREEIYPGASVSGQSLLYNHIQHHHLPNSHWVGTAKMGPSSSADAVVNEELQVYGVEGLRIVDASVFPTIPNGNTHSTVCAVASRAADLIHETAATKRMAQ